MGSLYRFGISLEKELIDKFDKHISHRKYRNRSEAIRDLIRNSLVQQEWDDDAEVAGAVTIVYDHHKRDLVTRLMDTQHEFDTTIISTQHIHLDHHNCLEIVAVKDKARRVRKLSCSLSSLKGVKHVSLSTSTTGQELH